MQPGGFGGGQGNGYPPGGFPPGAPGSPGAPPAPPAAHPAQPQQYGAPPGYGAPQGVPPGYGAPQGAPPGYGAPQGYGAVQGYGASPQPYVGAPQNSFGQAQSALKGAGGMMTAMKWGFIAVGGLCVLGGAVLALAVEIFTGVAMVFTGAVFVVVALLVLPRFAGMVGQATAMVDGFAAKEHLARTGLPANGRLLHVQQTGRLVNFNPEIQALVEVHHPQLGPYQTQTTAIVPQLAIPRAQPGAPVQVRVNPQNQHDIALVF